MKLVVRLFLLLLLSLTSCRSVDPALVDRTNRELQRYQQNPRLAEAAPAPGTPVPVPWNKGQYAVWAITEGEYTTLTEVQIEESDSNGAIVMITTISPKLRTTSRLTFRRQPHSHEEARSLLTQVIRRRGDDRALTYRFRRDMRVDMRESLESLWATLVPAPVDGGQPQTVTTTAGTLEGCAPATGLFLYAPLGLEVDGWVHPGVPINGLVMGKAKTGETVELVDMGWSGGGPNL